MPEITEVMENLILIITGILGGTLGGGGGMRLYQRRSNGDGLECKAHCADHEKLVANQAKSSQKLAVQEVKVDHLKDGFEKIEVKMDDNHKEVRADIHVLHDLIREKKG